MMDLVELTAAQAAAAIGRGELAAREFSTATASAPPRTR